MSGAADDLMVYKGYKLSIMLSFLQEKRLTEGAIAIGEGKDVLKAIIVDDEKAGRETLHLLLHEYFKERVNVCAVCASVQEAVTAIQTCSPDVVFLDIEMHGQTGFDLLEVLGDITFEIIFATAYSEYAVEAFKCHALGYLLKPISLSELTKSIDCLEQRLKKQKPNYSGQDLLQKLLAPQTRPSTIGIPTNNGIVFIDVESIIRCESDGNYTYIMLPDDKKILVSRTLKQLEDVLKEYSFIRVHKSHVINYKKISHYLRKESLIKLHHNVAIPLGRNFKDRFEEKIVIL